MLGDFNGHSELWGSETIDSRGRAIETFLSDNELVVLNDRSITRIDTRDGHGSAIDLSIVSSPVSWKFGWVIEGDTRGSDHFPILITSFETMAKKMTRRPRWRYEAANWDKFVRALDKPIDATPENFTTEVIAAANGTIPKTKSKINKRAVHWWNDEIAEAVKIRRKKLRKLRKLDQQDPRHAEALQAFQAARNEARRIIKEAKKNSWHNFVTGIHPQSSVAEVWKRVNAMKGNPRMGINRLLVNGEIIDDPVAVAERLADEFYLTSADGSLAPEHQAKRLTMKLRDPEFNFAEDAYYNSDLTMRELEWALRTCKGQSAGTDQVGYPMLQHLPDSAKQTLLNIYNQVWNSGSIPVKWKEGIIVPIPKPGKNPMVIGNQRPITLVSCIGKLLEKIVNRRLVQLLEERDVFGKNQHGFRAGRGVDSYFADLEEEILEAKTAKKHFEFVTLDITRAYDTAWRLPILKNLERWNVGGKMARFMKSFLEERSFRVAIGNSFSRNRTLDNGVPQGTILAVTSFLIRMTEVEQFINKEVQIKMYADDILLTASHENAATLRAWMRKAVFGVETWTTIHGFRLAADKSSMVHVCNRYKHGEREIIMLDSGPIEEVGSARILGVYIDLRFNFRQHNNKAKQSVELWNRILKTIGGRKIGAARKTLLLVHQAAVQAKLFFGWGIVSNASPAIIKKFESTYNAGIRQASGVFASSPTLSVMAESGMLPFEYAQTLNLVFTALRVQSRDQSPRSVFTRAQSNFLQITKKNLPQIASVERLSGRGWNASIPTIDWQMKESIRAGDSKEKVAAAFGELKEKFSNFLHAYTDGSVTDRHVGVGILVGTRGTATRLPEQCSIFSAEAFAIKEAISACENEHKPTVIFSDSASVLAAIESGYSTHPWIQKIELAITLRRITLCWIPGHTGIYGNEEADRLAKSAVDLDISPVPVPARDARLWAKNQILISWEKQWRSQRDNHLRRIKASILPGIDQMEQADQMVLTRLRIGHTRITHQGIFSNTKLQCDVCNKQLTVEHIIIDCPKYNRERLDAEIIGPIDYALQNDKHLEKKIIRFLKTIHLYHEI